VTVSLRVSDEVSAALTAGGPVVALETTLVSHGFSGGRGLAVAHESEERVRAAGAVPATVGIADGAIRVGLDAATLERFAEAGSAARKVGPRDIAACVVQRALGSTTVGGTLAACRLAGIMFMATGGIGGVHRGFASSLDISADLVQIARTRAVVVCSGAKPILDVPATAELLETFAVPVLGWQTPTIPVFYTAAGGPPVSAVVDTSQQAADVARAHWAVNPSGGVIVARPPANGLDLGEVIERAVEQVQRQGISGQAVTPAVLALIEDLSEGRSVTVNSSLIADNASLAGEVAVAYAARASGLRARRWVGRPEELDVTSGFRDD
jgi:pseudouridine-5'-phosphate glycosidase